MNKMDKMREDFIKGVRFCHKHKININGNDGTVCMEMMFNTQDIINVLTGSRSPCGLKRLQKLAKILNHEGLSFVDYYGEKVREWTKKEEKRLFKEFPEEHLRYIISYPDVYINAHRNCKEENEEMNEYCQHEYADYAKNDIYGDGLGWFWCGEF